MKIHGSNQPNLNPYQKQLQKYTESRTEQHVKVDQLHISDQAKKMQQLNGVHAARAQKIEALKAEVESGNYKVDSERIAKQILNFWA